MGIRDMFGSKPRIIPGCVLDEASSTSERELWVCDVKEIVGKEKIQHSPDKPLKQIVDVPNRKVIPIDEGEYPEDILVAAKKHLERNRF